MATEELSKPTPVRFRQKDLERMDALARRFGGSRSALVRHLVAEGLDLSGLEQAQRRDPALIA